MLQLLIRYKAVIRFLFTFLGSYFVLALLYHLYLVSGNVLSQPDYITRLVAFQSEAVISTFGYHTSAAPMSGFPAMNLFLNEQLVARIIEGCNSVSIIILFVAFMLAFYENLKSTLVFIFAGIVIIYVMNIVRIAILSIGIYELPQHTEFLHKILFPLIIYGTVFILWMLWIGIYTKNSRR